LQEAVIEHARDGDVVIAMGAGSIGSLAANIQRSLVSEHQDD
jgi:UDP-N-acetylmuramate-alanine ligase